MSEYERTVCAQCAPLAYGSAAEQYLMEVLFYWTATDIPCERCGKTIERYDDGSGYNPVDKMDGDWQVVSADGERTPIAEHDGS